MRKKKKEGEFKQEEEETLPNEIALAKDIYAFRARSGADLFAFLSYFVRIISKPRESS